MNKYRSALMGALLWVIFSAGGAMALTLSDWSYVGDVYSASGGEAVMGDESLPTALYQGVSLAAGTYSIQFDFKAAASSISDPPGEELAFPDTFYASLYFAESLGVNPLEDGLPAAISLFSLDAGGRFQVAAGSSFVDIDSRPGWTHYSLTFENTYLHAFPVFELYEMSSVAGDSSVRIDNVSFAPVTEPTPAVPEPGTVLLLGIGLAGLLVGRKLIS